MKRYKATILKYSKEAIEYCKRHLSEDSIVIPTNFEDRVIYIDESIKDKELLNFDVIRLSSCFWFDNGKEYIQVTQDNFKEFDFDKILNEKTDKYNELQTNI